MDSSEAVIEEPLIAAVDIENEKSNLVKRPSFIVKRVNENELLFNQSNSIPLSPTTTTTTPDLYQPLSSASSTSSSSDELNSYNFPTNLSNLRKQSIRYSCRLHCHNHHQQHNHEHEHGNHENNNNEKSNIHHLIVLPYNIWKKRFMDSHQCNEKNFWVTIMMSLIPNIVKLFLGISYIVIGALIFQEIDPSLAKESFPDILLFTFTSVTTIGYGSIVPTTKNSTIFCIFYICFGVPTVFLVLSNFSEMIAEFYWVIISTFKGGKEIETDHPHQLPVPVAMLLILGHSAIGSLLFAWTMPDLDYVDTFYFSFISITTIGFGDISPKTSSLSEAIIIITYLSFGIIILSAFIGSLTVLIRRIHYIGRSFEGAEYVEVYFGGSKFTIAELLEIVSEQFNVTPLQLREVIQELDELINIAVEEPQFELLKGPQGEDIILPPTRENQQSISISVTSKQTNYTSRFSDVEQVKLIQAVGTMCHLSQSGKKSFRSGAPSIIQHYSRTISNPPIQPHPSLPNAFKKRSLSIENTKIDNQINE